MWITLALALVQLLGPMLMEWFREWLDRRLQEEAKIMDKSGIKCSGSSTSTKLELLDRVDRSLWAWQRGKKRAVAACRQAVLMGVYSSSTKIG